MNDFDSKITDHEQPSPDPAGNPLTAAGNYFLRTKLNRPRLPDDHIPRERLLRRLNQFYLKPLTLVSAPAGYGKTTLLTGWASQTNLPCAWLSLDPGDDELSVFVGYLILALRTVMPDFGNDLIAFTSVTRLPPVPVIATAIINEMDQMDGDFALVLDDLHVISDSEVHNLLEFILQHPPRNLHLAISTRHDPPIYLGKLRAGNEVLEFRAQDLRFSIEESTRLIGPSFDDASKQETTRLLAEKTEGWAVGLRLATTALNQTSGSRIQPEMLQIENHYMVEYLINEVLSQQSLPVRNFLLYCSILGRFTPALCSAVMGDLYDEKEVVRVLYEHGLFIESLDNGRDWYRFHDFFRQFLQEQLSQHLDESGIAQLHQRAAEWFDQNGQLELAIVHSLRSGDTRAAVAILERASHTLMNEESWFVIESLLAKFPSDSLLDEPVLLALEAWQNLARFKLDKVRIAIKRLAEGMPFSDLSGEARRFVTSTLCCHSAIAAHWAHDFDGAIRFAREALATAPEDWLLERDYAWLHLTMASYHRDGYEQAMEILSEERQTNWRNTPGSNVRTPILGCFLYLAAGDLLYLKQAAEQAVVTAGETVQLATRAWFPAFAGIACYHYNLLDEAETYFSTTWRNRIAAHPFAALHSAIGLGKVYMAQGHRSEAWAVMEAAVRYCQEQDLLQLLPTVHAFMAELAWQLGHQSHVQRWISQGQSAVNHYVMPLMYEAKMALPKLLIAQNTADSRRRAAELLDELHTLLLEIRNEYYLIEVLALRAMIFEAEGDIQRSEELLTESVQRARPGGFIRIYVDLGDAIREPLRRLLSKGISPAFVQSILQAFPESGNRPFPAANEALVEPLTDRELEVVGLLEQRLSNKEIAEVLVISPTTAKRHTINIYQKLGVNSRRAAVLKATDLGLIPGA